jgi:hypothetical protein
MFTSGPNQTAKVRRPWAPRYLPDDGTDMAPSLSALLADINPGGRSLAGVSHADALLAAAALSASARSTSGVVIPGDSSAPLAPVTNVVGSILAFLRSKSVPPSSPAPVTELLGSLTHPASDN